MRAVSLRALLTTIRRHKLEPVNGEYQITGEIIAEAAAVDEAQGTGMPASKLEDLKAAIEGKPNSGDWEEANERR
jgi:hypothetical protein